MCKRADPLAKLDAVPRSAAALNRMLLYGGILTSCAVAFNLIWWLAASRHLLITACPLNDVDVRYLAGLGGRLDASCSPSSSLDSPSPQPPHDLLFLLGPSSQRA